MCTAISRNNRDGVRYYEALDELINCPTPCTKIFYSAIKEAITLCKNNTSTTCLGVKVIDKAIGALKVVGSFKVFWF